MIDWTIIGGLTLLTLVAFFVRKSWLNVVVMLLLLCTLLAREESINAYARSDAGRKAKAGEWSEQYKAGTDSILLYCEATRVYVVGTSVLIAVLFLRGILDRSRKFKNKV